jgi:class 3 adenylate cyclase
MDRKQAAVWVSDICGSAEYVEKHGEEAASKRVLACRRVIGDAIQAHAGLLHPIGDRIVAVFESADALVSAGSNAHTTITVRALSPGASAEALRIRSGAAFGTISYDDTGAIVGEVVNVAGRICELAGPDQFFVTKTLAGRLSTPVTTRLIGVFPVRGKASKLEVLEVLWSEEGLTARAPRAAADTESWVEVRFGDQVASLAPQKLVLKLGRDVTNDVVVTDRAVSREHAEIVHRTGRNYLVDRSTNGTYLRPGGRKPYHLHREELLLEDEGAFALGRADGPEIRYRVR